MLVHVVPSHCPVLAYPAVERLDRGMDLNMFVELHRVLEDLLATVTRVRLGAVVVVVDVVTKLEFVGEHLSARVTNARCGRCIMCSAEVLKKGFFFSEKMENIYEGRLVQKEEMIICYTILRKVKIPRYFVIPSDVGARDDILSRG